MSTATTHHNRRRSVRRPPVALERLEARALFSAAMAADLLHRDAIGPAVKHVVHAAPTAGGTGISAEYFADAGLTVGRMTRTDPTVSFKGAGGAAAALKAAGGARWTGSIAVTASSSYTFSVQGSGGVKLWVNGVQLINTAAITGGGVRANAAVPLAAGTRYAFTMEVAKPAGAAANVRLLWAAFKAKQVVVPQTSLFPATVPPELPATSAGLIGKYYVGADFSNLAMTRVDPTINFNFGSKGPDASIPAHTPFSIRWTGQVTPTASQNYTFTTTADDGVRVYVGNQLVIDNFVQQSSHTAQGDIALTAGVAYDLKVDYFQNGRGVGAVKVGFGVAGAKPGPLPANLLSSTPAASAGALSAVAAAADTVDLTWTGSTAATGYTVARSDDGGVTWADVGTTGPGVTAFDPTGLTANAAYAFRVTPLGSADTSTPSNVATVTTLTAPPGSVTATAASATDVDLAWADVPGETGFTVLQSANGGPFAAVAGTAAGVTTLHVTGLLPGVAYGYEVEALNAAAAPSLPAPAAAVTPTAAPAGLTAVGASTSTVTLAWADVPGNGGFQVERSTDGTTWAVAGTTAADTVTFTDAGLTAGTTYSYRVRGLSAANPAVASDPGSVGVAPTVTAAPTGVNAAAFSSTGVNLTWADVPGETGFNLFQSTDGGATYLPAGHTAGGVTAFAVAPLLPATAYRFAVQAVNSAGQGSALSGGGTGTTTFALAPAALVAAGTSTTSALLTWTPTVGATGYLIERSTDGVTWTAVATPAATDATYVDATLSPGTSYSYRIRATDAGGAGDASTVSVAVTVPAAVTAALAGLNVATSSVSFPAVAGATSYAVQRSNDGVGGWATVATVVPPAAPADMVAGPATSAAPLSAVVPNLAPSTVYYYRVIAANATGPAAPSPVVSQMTAPLARYALGTNLFGTTAGGPTTAASVYAVDMLGGTSTLVGQLAPGAYAATRSPTNGSVYYFVGATTHPAVYKWDPTTGNNTPVVDTNVYAAVPNRRAFDLAGNPWQTDVAGNLYRVDPPTHALTLVAQMKLGGVPLAAGVGNMAFSPAGALYLFNNGAVYTVNTTTAALTPALALGVSNVFATFGPSGLLYATDSNGRQYSLNPTALTSTLLANPAVPVFNGLTSTPAYVDLGVTATATPATFQAGHAAAYAVAVGNAGPTTADAGSVTVTVTLGTGVTFASVAGTGWTAVASNGGTTVTLTYGGSVAAGGTAPAVTLNVTVTSAAHLTATTTLAVAGDQFDTNPANGAAVVVSTVA